MSKLTVDEVHRLAVEHGWRKVSEDRPDQVDYRRGFTNADGSGTITVAIYLGLQGKLKDQGGRYATVLVAMPSGYDEQIPVRLKRHLKQVLKKA